MRGGGFFAEPSLLRRTCQVTVGVGKEHWREPKFEDSQTGMSSAIVSQEQARVVRV